MIEETTSLYKNKTTDYFGLERAELIPFIPKSANSILDIGCGEGGFGKTLKAHLDSEIWGIEPNVNAYQKALTRYDKVINKTFDQTIAPDLQSKVFDCITFNDVLEHLLDPSEALKLSKNYLSPEGVIVASIPNILYFEVFFNQILLKEDWKYEKHGTLDETHLRFFTRKSIVRLFEESGFDIITIQGINPYPSKKYKLINALFFNKLKDWKYLQFVVVAKQK